MHACVAALIPKHPVAQAAQQLLWQLSKSSQRESFTAAAPLADLLEAENILLQEVSNIRRLGQLVPHFDEEIVHVEQVCCDLLVQFNPPTTHVALP